MEGRHKTKQNKKTPHFTSQPQKTKTTTTTKYITAKNNENHIHAKCRNFPDTEYNDHNWTHKQAMASTIMLMNCQPKFTFKKDRIANALSTHIMNSQPKFTFKKDRTANTLSTHVQIRGIHFLI